MTRAGPDFIIVGTPRSGTTLVQRLASEIPGVRVPPETHFFTGFYAGLIRRATFPLSEDVLRNELLRYMALDTSADMNLNVESIIDGLGGGCGNPVELFGAITRALAGNAEVVGEKTPDHLRWWRPLSKALPDLRVVGVVRDPRAVVSSHMRLRPGSAVAALVADRWRSDQQEMEKAQAALPPGHFLQLRYEDVVTDPDRAKSLLANLLDVGLQDHIESPKHLFLSWEESWKALAVGPITAQRVGAWSDVLSSREIEQVEMSCIRYMSRLGYQARARRFLRTAIVNPSPALGLAILRVRFSRFRQRRWIERQRLEGL
jgi:hypothetical protein